MTIKEQIMADMKAAMKAHDTARLGAIRLLMAAIKQKKLMSAFNAAMPKSLPLSLN